MSAIEELIKEIDNLQPIPAVLNQIMEMIDDPNCDMKELSDLIMFDPSLTATLLKLSNSAYYGLNRTVDSVKDAISLLGLDQVVEMVILKSGSKNFSKGQQGYGLHEGDLWRHAVSSALISKNIAIKLDIENTASIFTIALIKDIGKVILDRFVGSSFKKINKLINEEGFSFKEAEKKIIGVDHAELGAKVASMWGFSKKMVKIIRNHHLTEDHETADVENNIIYIADNICMMMGIGIGSDGLAYRFHQDVLEKLKITPVDLQIIIAEFGDEIGKVEKLINLV